MFHLPTEVERALQQLKAYQAEVASNFTRQVLVDGPVTCRRGCNYCCCYPLYVTILEGIIVYRWLAENRRWGHKLRERFRSTEEKTWGLSTEVWLLGTIPCPLLGDDGLCLGYTCRPVICRTVYSRSDANSCHPHRFLQAPLVPRKEAMTQWSKLERSLWKPPPAIVPFSTAVLLGERICKGDVDFRDCNALTIMRFRKW